MIDDKDLTKFQHVITKVYELGATISENFQDDDFEDTAGSILANYYTLFNRFCPYQIDDQKIGIQAPSFYDGFSSSISLSIRALNFSCQ